MVVRARDARGPLTYHRSCKRSQDYNHVEHNTHRTAYCTPPRVGLFLLFNPSNDCEDSVPSQSVTDLTRKTIYTHLHRARFEKHILVIHCEPQSAGESAGKNPLSHSSCNAPAALIIRQRRPCTLGICSIAPQHNHGLNRALPHPVRIRRRSS